MTKRRFRRGNFQKASFPASKGLINRSEAPQTMKRTYARDVENMIPRKKNVLSKRHGLTDGAISGITAGEKILSGESLGLTDGTFKLVCYTDGGKIYHTNTDLDTWTALETGLTTSGVLPRFEFFNSSLIIYDGINPNLVYDGSTTEPIQEYVEDVLASNEAKVDTDTFTLDPGTGREDSDYPVGRTVRITMDSGATVIVDTVLTSSYSSPTTTVNLATNSISGTSIDKVEYMDAPEPFSVIKTAHDRLWALSGGELKAQGYRNSADRMKFFYTEQTNNEHGWFNATTQNVPFVNIADKHIVNDELVGIDLFYDKLVFFGRRNTQMWAGTIPTSGGDLSWNRTFPVGALHGDLIVNVENDLVFYTPDGLRNFSKVYQSNDIESQQEVGSKVTPMMQTQIDLLTSDDTKYKTGRAFLYPRGGFYGFRMPKEVHVRVLEEDVRGWVRFTGLVKDCTDYTVAPDGKLYCFYEDGTYIYDDRNEVYGDNGENIKTSWATPWYQPKKGHQWANKYLELIAEPGDDMTISLSLLKNNDVASRTTELVISPVKPANWDDGLWDVSFWDSAGDTSLPTIDEKFIAQTFAYVITTDNTEGPLDIVEINLYGKTER